MNNFKLQSDKIALDVGDAFKDIESLISRASEMVKLAESLSSRLEETNLKEKSVHQSIASLGLSMTFTK